VCPRGGCRPDGGQHAAAIGSARWSGRVWGKCDTSGGHRRRFFCHRLIRINVIGPGPSDKSQHVGGHGLAAAWRVVVTTICWTVIHHAAAPIARGAAKIAHVARRIVRPVVHHGGRVAHHGSTLATRPRVWFELVCKVVPAAVAGGGLFIPHPAGMPPGYEPAGLIQPVPPGMLPGLLPPGLWPHGLPPGLLAPALTPNVTWGWIIPPDIPPLPYNAPPVDTGVIEYPPPVDTGVIEPSTGLLLLTALVGLLLARNAARHGHASRASPLSG
jgi:hypothetical protein